MIKRLAIVTATAAGIAGFASGASATEIVVRSELACPAGQPCAVWIDGIGTCLHPVSSPMQTPGETAVPARCAPALGGAQCEKFWLSVRLGEAPIDYVDEEWDVCGEAPRLVERNGEGMISTVARNGDRIEVVLRPGGVH